jgi:hypothetical protein
MVKGHLHQQRQNIRSTQSHATAEDPTLDVAEEDLMLFMHSWPMPAKSKIYTHLTECIPQHSSSNNKYILVLYDFDRNSILTKAMKNHTDKEMITSYETLICTHIQGTQSQAIAAGQRAPRALTQFIGSQ